MKCRKILKCRKSPTHLHQTLHQCLHLRYGPRQYLIFPILDEFLQSFPDLSWEWWRIRRPLIITGLGVLSVCRTFHHQIPPFVLSSSISRLSRTVVLYDICRRSERAFFGANIELSHFSEWQNINIQGLLRLGEVWHFLSVLCNHGNLSNAARTFSIVVVAKSLPTSTLGLDSLTHLLVAVIETFPDSTC